MTKQLLIKIERGNASFCIIQSMSPITQLCTYIILGKKGLNNTCNLRILDVHRCQLTLWTWALFYSFGVFLSNLYGNPVAGNQSFFNCWRMYSINLNKKEIVILLILICFQICLFCIGLFGTLHSPYRKRQKFFL